MMLFFVQPLTAQINMQKEWLENTIEVLFPGRTFKGQKIQCIEVETNIKQENTRIERAPKKYIFSYNTNGEIESLIELNKKDSGYDSVYTFYYYNKETRLLISRTYNNGSYTAVYETYDDKHRLVKRVQCSETNLSGDFNFFKLGQQIVEQSESFSYESLGNNQTRKRFLNDINTVYKEGIVYTDESGTRVTEQDFTFVTTGVRVSNQYVYDKQGRLTEKKYNSDAAGNLSEVTKYIYQDALLNQERYERNNVLRNECFYFYHESNNLVESIVCKQTNSYRIDIFNFMVSFYP
ncbi:MAG: hypothetical protein IT238_02315 [Bacteroidia bacterium]|nr:hypothetical protein [Bacteroidia bacterium]MCZ2249361.1 hypothetical protein [Bacteroidia bacterium]